MIIGISGKKQHGKNTVCKIIQYLIRDKETNGGMMPFEQCLPVWDNEEQHKSNCGTNWQRKLFADKLKDIVCLLLSCTREQLEDSVFKETPLGEEWGIYKLWSPRLNKFMPEIALTYQEMDQVYQSKYWNQEDNFEVRLTILTPRLLLQLIGTECGRNIIHPNIWVNALMSEYKEHLYDNISNEIVATRQPNWIITDVRFPNELKAIEDKGGVVIRVNRFMPFKGMPQDLHISETSLDNHEFKYYIGNDETIEDLIISVKTFLKQLNLL